jgi:hypothetical protein
MINQLIWKYLTFFKSLTKNLKLSTRYMCLFLSISVYKLLQGFSISCLDQNGITNLYCCFRKNKLNQSSMRLVISQTVYDNMDLVKIIRLSNSSQLLVSLLKYLLETLEGNRGKTKIEQSSFSEYDLFL